MKITRSWLTRIMLLALSLFPVAMVFAAAGDPVPGVDVSLEQIPGGNRVSTKTAPDGAFSFTGLTPGWYVLRVQRPKAVTKDSGSPAGTATTYRNYNSAKSNTAGIAAPPATPTGYWLAVEGVEAAEARTLRQVISEDRISKGSEMEVVIGQKGGLSGRITKEAVGLPAGETRPRWGTLPAERRFGDSVATAMPAEGPVTLRGQIPNLADSEDGSGRVLLVDMDTGQVIAEATLDENGAFALRTAENPEKKGQGGKEICREKNGQRECFTFTLLPADPESCQPLAIEDTTLCIDLKSKD